MLKLDSGASGELADSDSRDTGSVVDEACTLDDRPDIEGGSDDQLLVDCMDMRDLVKNGRSPMQACVVIY